MSSKNVPTRAASSLVSTGRASFGSYSWVRVTTGIFELRDAEGVPISTIQFFGRGSLPWELLDISGARVSLHATRKASMAAAVAFIEGSCQS